MKANDRKYEHVADAAAGYFDSGYNCAESLLLALAPADARTPDGIQRAATALGGGIARAGLACGCLTGAAVAVGLRMGRTSPDDADAKERAYRVTASIARRFAAEFGTTECRKLTGLDFNKDNPQDELDRVHAEVCARVVRFVAEAAAEEIAAAETGGE